MGHMRYLYCVYCLDKTQEKLNQENVPMGNLLHESILDVLGDDIAQVNALGKPLQSEVVERWLYIAKNSLDESVRKSLLEKYPPPDNAVLLSSPQLNLMVHPEKCLCTFSYFVVQKKLFNYTTELFDIKLQHYVKTLTPFVYTLMCSFYKKSVYK